jgi:K+-transporting ATPase A subunit
MCKALGSNPSAIKKLILFFILSVHVVYDWNPSTWKAEAGEVKFNAILSYIARPWSDTHT